MSRRFLFIASGLLLLVACGPSAAPPAPTPTQPRPTVASAAAQVSGGLTAVPKPGASPSASAAASNQGVTVATNAKQFSAPPAMQIDPAKHYTATIDTSVGSMKADLFANEAPIRPWSYDHGPESHPTSVRPRRPTLAPLTSPAEKSSLSTIGVIRVRTTDTPTSSAAGRA